MKKRFVLLFAALAGYPLHVSGQAIPPIHMGYDEGLAVRVEVMPKIAVHAALNYRVVGPDTSTDQPLQSFLFKLGGTATVWGDEKVNLGGFGEYVFLIEQFETETYLAGAVNHHKRFNTADHVLRAGPALLWAPLPRLSLIYRMGLEYRYHGQHYVLNGTRSDTEGLENSFHEFGVYGSPLNTGEERSSSLGDFIGSPLHNVSVYFRF